MNMWIIKNSHFFFFSLLRQGNVSEISWKHAPSLSRAFANCFIKPSLICSRGKTIFSLSTSCPWMMLCFPTVNISHLGHFLYTQCCSLAQLSERHKSRDTWCNHVVVPIEHLPFLSLHRCSNYVSGTLKGSKPFWFLRISLSNILSIQ